MAANRVLRSILLTAGALLIGACASQPASRPDGVTPLLEKKFQQAARHYLKFQHEGQTVYCKKGATRSLPPADCITESALRLQVENYEKRRNTVPPPVVAGTGQGGIG